MTLLTTILFLFSSQANAEIRGPIKIIADNDDRINRETFIELNTGAALTFEGIFPGASLLFGQTYTLNTHGIFEYELGLAVPTIVTSKVGIGVQSKDKKFQATVGLRHFPMLTYVQFVHKINDKHSLLSSVEISPFGATDISFWSYGIATLGWRYAR